MQKDRFLIDGAGPVTVLLAHGSGAPMDTPFMSAMAEGLSAQGLRVARFEFDYMAARRTGGPKRPPPRVDYLCAEYHAALQALGTRGPLVIGGKSLGGRVASLIAEDAGVEGVLCLGYPFHPPAKPETLRIAHLADIGTPTLICQGTRDPFGTRGDVAGYDLSGKVSLHWLEDGNHDLSPRKRVTGLTQADHIASACDAAAGWIGRL